jgi:hypothetical protein
VVIELRADCRAGSSCGVRRRGSRGHGEQGALARAGAVALAKNNAAIRFEASYAGIPIIARATQAGNS